MSFLKERSKVIKINRKKKSKKKLIPNRIYYEDFKGTDI